MSDEQRQPTRRWWVIVAGLLVGAAIGYVVGTSAGPRVSESELLVIGASSGAPTDDSALTANQYVNQRMPTYADISSADIVTGPATEQLGLEPDELAGTITATSAEGSTLIGLAVTGPTPQAAQDRNTAVTDALRAAIETTENVPGQPVRVQLSVVSSASLPEAAVLSGRTILLIGAILGLLAGIVTAMTLGRRDRADAARQASLRASAPGRSAIPSGPPMNGRAAPPRSPRQGSPSAADGMSGPGRDRP